MPLDKYPKLNGRRQHTILADPDEVAEFIVDRPMDYLAYCHTEVERLTAKGKDAVVETIDGVCGVYSRG